MSEKIKKEIKKSEDAKPKFYKGYDIKWLRKETDHPDYKLVAEYDKKYGVGKE